MAKTTPLSAARNWAAEHPDVAGALRIVATTRGGRGGWATKRLDTKAYVSNGKAALARGQWRTHTYNGICRVCGRVYLQPVLTDVYAPHPQAGELLDIVLPPGVTKALVGEMGHTRACPDCIHKNSLTVGYIAFAEYKRDGLQKVYQRNLELPIAKYDMPDLGELDIRNEQTKELA